uniref:hypothetical protein n=1 Tax=Flavobacterium sp. ACAM 123 TaxID=1189620 RepID=UPI000555CBEE
MKKSTILTMQKSVRHLCHTFACSLEAGFSDFFETSRSTKRLVFYVTLLLLGLGFTANTYGQLVGGAAVKANFGIDGDAYANLLQFGNLGGPADTDDWFNTTYAGNGRGVIKQTDPIPTTPNESFSFRQSITTPTAPYPYPIVDGYLWVDAVYGRDNYVKGGSAEKSYFGGSGDKNSDNPSTWNIASGGSVPAKDDIIDVYAHLRGQGPKLPTLVDPRPFTTLWAYAAASVVVTNGNKHVDFEFFRTALETPADLNDPAKTGPDGGRTAFTFNLDGSVSIPGTIIISIDYTNGGTSPQVRIRVWMDETVFNNYDNTAPLRPFTLDKNTAFEKGTDSGTFGYAAILENVGAVQNIFGRVNDNASTLGPPWGTFEGVGPSAVADYQPLQFVEIGINLTAFGLDKRGTQDPCSNILGSLLVKTRSSGGGPNEGAFGSELKDFAGPYLFGNTGTPPTVTVPNKIVCEIAATGFATVDLTAGATTNPAGGTIQYFLNPDYTGEITSPTTYSAAIGTRTIHTRTESQTNPGCFGYGTFTVTVNANATANAGPDEVKCQTAPSGPTSFTLAGTATNGTPGWAQVGQTGTANANINDPGSLTSTVSVSGVGTVTLRLTTTSNSTPPCDPATDDVVLTVNANP